MGYIILVLFVFAMLGLLAVVLLGFLAVLIIFICAFIGILASINPCFDVNVLNWELSGGILPVLKSYDFSKFRIIKTIKRTKLTVKVFLSFSPIRHPMSKGIFSRYPAGYFQQRQRG